MARQAKIYVAGHRGMVGSAIVRTLHAQGQTNIVTRTHAELDLTDQSEVRAFFAKEKPDQVYLAAARVGGIYANNTFPADFIYQNLMKITVFGLKLHLPQIGAATHVRIRIAYGHAGANQRTLRYR
jgi:nucleoside-diphosphate-sugar epimerase